MSLDNALLTIHALAALVMPASLSLDWIGVLRLRRVSTLPSAREGMTTSNGRPLSAPGHA
ncbi:hypothetical protein [Streptomyces cavernae]|uniref:hypothetical protein n=1 Tax=Streptomyces cavernae TaxID=2259034 RepID=UPI000FEB6737|nr:hypothetical protein [Streptomyces cavernae]